MGMGTEFWAFPSGEPFSSFTAHHTIHCCHMASEFVWNLRNLDLRIRVLVGRARSVLSPQAPHDTQGYFQELRGLDVGNKSIPSEEGMDREDILGQRTGTVGRRSQERERKIVFA